MKNYDEFTFSHPNAFTSLWNKKKRRRANSPDLVSKGRWDACGSLWWQPLALRPSQCGLSKASKPFQIPKPHAHETAQEDAPITIARHRQHKSANRANTEVTS